MRDRAVEAVEPTESAVRKCIFCGKPLAGRQRAKEHIYPMWLQEDLNLRQQDLYYYILDRAEGVSAPTRKLVFNAHVAGRVCSDCNNGWMSSLEEQAQPLLLPLVNGTLRGIIDLGSQRVISVWLFKTILVLHSVSEQRSFIPSLHYSSLANGQAIPNGVFVAIAKAKDAEGDGFFWIQAQDWRWLPTFEELAPTERMEVCRKTYRFVLRAGHLLGRVHYWPIEYPLLGYEHRQECVRYIHPALNDLAPWPPGASFDGVPQFDENLFIRTL